MVFTFWLSLASIKEDFLSWQKSLAYSLRIFVNNFSLLSPLQRVLSLLSSKFSTNLLFAGSKCHVTIQRQWQLKVFKMAEGSDVCSGETLLAPCPRKKRLQRVKMTKDPWAALPYKPIRTCRFSGYQFLS